MFIMIVIGIFILVVILREGETGNPFLQKKIGSVDRLFCFGSVRKLGKKARPNFNHYFLKAAMVEYFSVL